MKILLVGDWHSDLHEDAVFAALQRLGHDVISFRWWHYFRPTDDNNYLKMVSGRLQNKYLFGPRVLRLNRDVLQLAVAERPELILIYRGTHILARTLRVLRANLANVILVGYNNDDPFASGHSFGLWRHFLRGVPEYDLMLAYRKHNLLDFRKAGAKQVELLRSWFIPELNHPVDLTSSDQLEYGSDVVFIGHYEDDGRVACLEEIVRRGWHLRLFGHPEWEPAIRRSPELSALSPLRTVWGIEYNKALCGAKIALCFFSKLNRDTYTRRCFEIPATCTMMLSEYSEDLANLYCEGEEAEFFRSKDDMMNKIAYYLANEQHRRMVAEKGFRRVHADGHDVYTRIRKFISHVENIRGSRQ